jgi:hypothetical protein
MLKVSFFFFSIAYTYPLLCLTKYLIQSSSAFSRNIKSFRLSGGFLLPRASARGLIPWPTLASWVSCDVVSLSLLNHLHFEKEREREKVKCSLRSQSHPREYMVFVQLGDLIYLKNREKTLLTDQKSGGGRKNSVSVQVTWATKFLVLEKSYKKHIC